MIDPERQITLADISLVKWSMFSATPDGFGRYMFQNKDNSTFYGPVMKRVKYGEDSCRAACALSVLMNRVVYASTNSTTAQVSHMAEETGLWYLLIDPEDNHEVSLAKLSGAKFLYDGRPEQTE